MSKSLKIHKQSIIKITKKDYKKKLVKDVKVFLKKKKKNVTIWSYGGKRYENLQEEEKQKLNKYRKKIS